MTDLPNPSTPQTRFASWRKKQGAFLAGAALIVLAAGAAAGAGGTKLAQRFQPQSVMLLPTGPIDKMQDDSAVAVKGSVAEVFGNKFVMQDDSGRALVDLGPRGEYAKPVEKGEAITVQGRFDRGVLHANLVVHADGRSEGFGPPKPPRPDRGPPGRPGPRAERGPDRGPPPPGADRGPPPPPPAADAPPPPADAPPPPAR